MSFCIFKYIIDNLYEQRLCFKKLINLYFMVTLVNEMNKEIKGPCIIKMAISCCVKGEK